MKLVKKYLIVVVLGVILIMLLLVDSKRSKRIKPVSQGNKYSAEPTINSDEGRMVTIDGTDPASGDIIDPINVWENYQTRTYAGRVKHGQKVTVIKRSGDGVFIETKAGMRGWVTYFFIKEYK